MTIEELVDDADADEPVAPDDQWYCSETAVDDNGVAHFVVRVEAPSWMRNDRVRLPGAPPRERRARPRHRPCHVDAPRRHARRHPLRRRAHRARFDGELTAPPVADAWYLIEVVGLGSMWPLDAGQTPYTMTNPIEVDQDDDGVWTPPAQTNTTRPAAFRQVPPSDARSYHHHH